MAKSALANVLILLVNSSTLLTSFAYPSCTYLLPPSKPPNYPPKSPPVHIRPPLKPHVTPPINPPPPSLSPLNPPVIPKPSIAKPPPPETPCPPHLSPPKLCPPPPLPPPKQETCPINTLKLGACVDVLGGLVHIRTGSGAKDECCPMLEGLVDLDAASCLCIVIKAKLLNINLIIPITLEVLADCGKTPPPGFMCPA